MSERPVPPNEVTECEDGSDGDKTASELEITHEVSVLILSDLSTKRCEVIKNHRTFPSCFEKGLQQVPALDVRILGEKQSGRASVEG